jgi:hypothetical protein
MTGDSLIKAALVRRSRQLAPPAALQRPPAIERGIERGGYADLAPETLADPYLVSGVSLAWQGHSPTLRRPG